MSNSTDLSGQIFNNILVLRKQGLDKSNNSMWLCRCVCNKEFIVQRGHLKTLKSCGCLTPKFNSESHLINVLGYRSGKLTVIEQTSHRTKYGQVIWKCRCDCGNLSMVASGDIISQHTKSCGCVHTYCMPSGENHHFWKGNSRIYPPQWTNKLRTSIRNRDNHLCQFPDCIYDDTKELFKLDVHHIDGNKNNCDPSNLISLCGKHHMKIEHNNPSNWIEYFNTIIGDYDYKRVENETVQT